MEYYPSVTDSQIFFYPKLKIPVVKNISLYVHLLYPTYSQKFQNKTKWKSMNSIITENSLQSKIFKFCCPQGISHYSLTI